MPFHLNPIVIPVRPKIPMSPSAAAATGVQSELISFFPVIYYCVTLDKSLVFLCIKRKTTLQKIVKKLKEEKAHASPALDLLQALCSIPGYGSEM